MNPALSVLIFSVSSGAGYGLIIWMISSQLIHGSVFLTELIVGGLIGLSLITIGLLSSTLHLANPKNAWRAFNRFRTSWLSREGVFAVLFYPVVLAYALTIYLNNGEINKFAQFIGGLSIAVAITTVICTGMIYASLKPIRQWHNPLTTPLYILFSLMSGSLAFNGLQFAIYNELSKSLLIGFLVSAVITTITKLTYFLMIGKPGGATINSATSLGGKSQAQVRLLDVGHTSDTFLNKEFVFDIGELTLFRGRRVMQILVFIVPIIAVAIAYEKGHGALVYFALISLLPGLLLERWLFFAEARHVVRLYHGDQRT